MHAFRLSAPSIISEVIDGEAIIIDMLSGAYFSTEGLGAVLWQVAISGRSRTTIVESVSAAYPDAATAGADTADFLEQLLSNDLIIEDAPAGAGEIGLPAWPAMAYVPPQLQRHADMQDLIMLDPIHDVDAVGWPKRREDTPPMSVA